MELFNAKDLIWAKMRGFSPWPAMVVDAPEKMLKVPKKHGTCRCVYFFGSKNYAWMETRTLTKYDHQRGLVLMKESKSPAYKEALNEIKDYLDDPSKTDSTLLPPAKKEDLDAIFNRIRYGEGGGRGGGGGGDDDDDDDDDDDVDVDVDESQDNDMSSIVSKSPPATRRKNSRASRAPKARSVSAKSTRSMKSDKVASASKGPTKRKQRASVGTARKKINANFMTPSSSRRSGGTALLNRLIVSRPDLPTVDMNVNSKNLAARDITPSDLTFGFLGLGIMGGTIVKNLICTGHKVVVWNRTTSKCTPFTESGAEYRDTPAEVVEAADITFCCVSDPKASKDLVFGNCGVLDLKNWGDKAYVEMSTIDPETSIDIAFGIKSAGGSYLEAQIQGTREEAEEGNVVILAGGERSVFDKCHSCFKSIAKNTFFLGGDNGNACKVNLILQTLVGVSLVGLSEALALADRFSISLKDIMDILELTSMKSALLTSKGKEMAKGEFNPQHPLSHMQKDLRLVLDMAESVDQSMPTTAAANEVFKHAKRLGYSEHDSSAVFVRARF